MRVLEGRSACHKLTAAVENFARLRWPDLVAQRSYGAVGRLLLAPSGNNAHPSAFFPKDPAEFLYWCDHAGVLVIAAALAGISPVSPTPQKILAQWTAALLLGAQNIEQTKLRRDLLAEEQASQAHQLRAVKGPELAAKLALEGSTDTPE